MRLRKSTPNIPNNTAVCGLLGWRHSCSEGFNGHHLISKNRLRGNPKAKRYAEHTHPEVFITRVCGFANRTKLADQQVARAILLKGKIDLFGMDYVLPIWEEIVGMFEDKSELYMAWILSNLPDDYLHVSDTF